MLNKLVIIGQKFQYDVYAYRNILYNIMLGLGPYLKKTS